MNEAVVAAEGRHPPSYSHARALGRPRPLGGSVGAAVGEGPYAQFNRACALEQIHRFEEALADLDRSLAARPDSTKASSIPSSSI